MKEVIIKANANVVCEITNTGMLKADTIIKNMMELDDKITMKKDNVIPSIDNFLYEGRAIKKAMYDMLTNEIHLFISDRDWVICPNCGCGYDEYPAISRKDNKTEICPRCGEMEALNEFFKNESEE